MTALEKHTAEVTKILFWHSVSGEDYENLREKLTALRRKLYDQQDICDHKWITNDHDPIVASNVCELCGAGRWQQ